MFTPRRSAAASIVAAAALAAPATAVAMPADPPLPVHPTVAADEGPSNVTVVRRDTSDDSLAIVLSGAALGIALAGAAYTVRLSRRGPQGHRA
jgi:hypothetical protein